MFAMYNRKNSSLNLTGRPVVTKSKDTFKASRIAVNLDTEDISLEGKVSGNVVDEQKEKPQEEKEDNKQEVKEGKKNDKTEEIKDQDDKIQTDKKD